MRFPTPPPVTATVLRVCRVFAVCAAMKLEQAPCKQRNAESNEQDIAVPNKQRIAESNKHETAVPNNRKNRRHPERSEGSQPSAPPQPPNPCPRSSVPPSAFFRPHSPHTLGPTHNITRKIPAAIFPPPASRTKHRLPNPRVETRRKSCRGAACCAPCPHDQKFLSSPIRRESKSKREPNPSFRPQPTDASFCASASERTRRPAKSRNPAPIPAHYQSV
jgi:hypothetical protein